jgi:hypothetical protein
LLVPNAAVRIENAPPGVSGSAVTGGGDKSVSAAARIGGSRANVGISTLDSVSGTICCFCAISFVPIESIRNVLLRPGGLVGVNLGEAVSAADAEGLCGDGDVRDRL